MFHTTTTQFDIIKASCVSSLVKKCQNKELEFHSYLQNKKFTWQKLHILSSNNIRAVNVGSFLITSTSKTSQEEKD
jgi:hypothetical protein